MTDDRDAQGLIDFYSSQADMLLAQYENINQLLGPTTDWTHPGTHCEILLRDFLRRHLIQGMSVDKGFVYGRVERNGVETHGPEIDILIHDTKDYRPVFRLEDFVIVQPESVLGMIQVKRTFRSGADGSLAKGIRQVVTAKQHLLDVTIDKKIRKQVASYGSDDHSGIKRYPEFPDLRPVFSGVVSFEDATDKSQSTYQELLHSQYVESQRYEYSSCEFDTGVYVLPNFVGSLKHLSLHSDGRNVGERKYCVFECEHNGKNIVLQVFLAVLVDMLFDFRKASPPFAFPKSLPFGGIVQVPKDGPRK